MNKSRIIIALVGAGIVTLLILAWAYLYGNQNTVTRSFYYWKNNFNLTKNEISLLDSMGITKVYFKLMDIDLSNGNQAHPVVSPMVANMEGMKNKTLVPVIFITNRTMLAIPATEVKPLAEKMWQQVQQHVLQHYKIEEVQLDCDWNESSKTNFFNLITEFKNVSGLKISATIRLYQYKYHEKAGVPPADRGMLMFYNMGSFKEPSNANSIFDAAIAKQYIDGVAKYPLPLDAALPSFGWGVLYRNNNFLALVDEMDERLVGNLTYLQPVSPHIYRVTADTVLPRSANFDDIYLRNGDIFKIEEMDAINMAEAAQLLRPMLNSNKFAVSFFDFDQETINTITPAVYEKTFDSFK